MSFSERRKTLPAATKLYATDLVLLKGFKMKIKIHIKAKIKGNLSYNSINGMKTLPRCSMSDR